MDSSTYRSARKRGGSFHVDDGEGSHLGNVQFMTPCYEGQNDTHPEPLDLSKLCMDDDEFVERTNSDDSDNTAPGEQSISSEDELDDGYRGEVRVRSRSRSVHQNDAGINSRLPPEVVDNQGSMILGAYGAEIIEYEPEVDSTFSNSNIIGRSYSTSREQQIRNMAAGKQNGAVESTHTPAERTGPLQHREVLALKKGLEEANQSINRDQTREDEEERMAADAEKRKRNLLNGRSLSADAAASRRVKILMLGDSGVGKSSLMLRWTLDTFSPSLTSTVGVNFKTRNVPVLGEQVHVQVWDTAGQEQFHKITTSYYRGANGIMLVYDVSDSKSFDNVLYWIKNIKSHAASTVQVALIGNKSDLRGSNEVTGPCIESSQGRELAATFGIPFVETSAKESHNVDTAFMKLSENIVQLMIPTFTMGLSGYDGRSAMGSGGHSRHPSAGSNIAAENQSLDRKGELNSVEKANKSDKNKFFGLTKDKRSKGGKKAALPAGDDQQQQQSTGSGKWRITPKFKTSKSSSSNSNFSSNGSSSEGKVPTGSCEGGDERDGADEEVDKEKCVIA